MAQYVDGFVLPVPEDKLDAYLEMARQAGEIWREHGALERLSHGCAALRIELLS